MDNVALDGPIPQMVDLVGATVARNVSRRSVVGGGGRLDVWEYPLEAVREVVVNVLMHRDYHPLAQGTQTRVEMFPDRLAVTSPGGLYGPVDPESLMHTPITASRNNTLGRLLEDVEMPRSARTVAENRGSGLIAVSADLRRNGLPPASITSTISHFTITLRRGERAPDFGAPHRIAVASPMPSPHANRTCCVCSEKERRPPPAWRQSLASADKQSASTWRHSRPWVS